MTYRDFISCKKGGRNITVNFNFGAMEKQEKIFTTSLIAALLGVNDASIDRWVESGKLKCNFTEEGKKLFTLSQLSEFSERYNVFMKFLELEYANGSGLNYPKFKKISANQ